MAMAMMAKRSLLPFLIGAILRVSTSESLKGEQQKRELQKSPPNVLVFIVDDLGWNQVGYHAAPSGNNEIKTPHIDNYATTGIEMDRAYMTPWCGPSRAAIMTGRTNVYNANVSTLISAFDDDIGYVAGLPPGTNTIATAFKAYGESIGIPYKAWFNGKWGIGVSLLSFVYIALFNAACAFTHHYPISRVPRFRTRRWGWDLMSFVGSGVPELITAVRLLREANH
jgi:hypothetical protein